MKAVLNSQADVRCLLERAGCIWKVSDRQRLSPSFPNGFRKKVKYYVATSAGPEWVSSLFGAGPASFYGGGYAAAGAEFAAHYGPDRVAGFHNIFEDLVDDVLLEDAEVAVAEEVFLERFEFEAAAAGHVANGERTEVGQTGLGADGSELRIVDDDFVAGKLILPGFDGGKGEIEAGLCVVVGIAGLLRHIDIVRGTNVNTGSSKFLHRIHANFCFLRG